MVNINFLALLIPAKLDFFRKMSKKKKRSFSHFRLECAKTTPRENDMSALRSCCFFYSFADF